MPRYKLILEYDGAPFVGWQRQDNGSSVQAAIEEAAFALCGERISLHAAGRTDAGVHALAMTAHFDLDKEFKPDVVRDAINFHLKPAPIAVLEASLAGDDFHARFSCVGRRYEYRIVNRRAPLTIARNRAWRVVGDLDAGAMHEAAQALVGRHDFTTFRAAACQAKSPVKTLNEVTVERTGDAVAIHCAARSFLHHQVRAITGTLVEVGKGKWRIDNVADALEAKDRSRCGPTAPADGLYFVEALYPGLR